MRGRGNRASAFYNKFYIMILADSISDGITTISSYWHSIIAVSIGILLFIVGRKIVHLVDDYRELKDTEREDFEEYLHDLDSHDSD